MWNSVLTEEIIQFLKLLDEIVRLHWIKILPMAVYRKVCEQGEADDLHENNFRFDHF